MRAGGMLALESLIEVWLFYLADSSSIYIVTCIPVSKIPGGALVQTFITQFLGSDLRLSMNIVPMLYLVCMLYFHRNSGVDSYDIQLNR